MNEGTKFDKVLSALLAKLNPLLENIRAAENKRVANEKDRQDNEEARQSALVKSIDDKSTYSQYASAKAIYELFKKNIVSNVYSWLDTHPEATTTVQDNSITQVKLKDGLINYVYLELSETDGEQNTQLLNETLSHSNVLLKSGMTYPIKPTVIVDGHTLDLNGSTLRSSETKYAGGYISLVGKNPCIRNGTVLGNFSVGIEETGYSFYELERGVSLPVGAYSNALIENVEFSKVIGYAISCDESEAQYHVRQNVSSIENLEETIELNHMKEYVFKCNINRNYGYILASTGIGYNYFISIKPVKYVFYNNNEEIVYTITKVPGSCVKIPKDASYVKVSTYGYETDDFTPFTIRHYKYDCLLTIKSCNFHHNSSLAIANLIADATVEDCISYRNGYVDDNTSVYTNSTTGFIDIEDRQTSNLIVRNCKSTNENLGILSQAYNLNVVDSELPVSVRNGFNAFIQNVRGKISCKNNVKVSANNCVLENIPISAQQGSEANFIGNNFIFNGCYPKSPELYKDFFSDLTKCEKISDEQFNGSVRKPIIGTVHTNRITFKWTPDNPIKTIPKNSNLTIISKNNGGTYAEVIGGNVFGVHATNFFFVPTKEFTIFDSSFYNERDFGLDNANYKSMTGGKFKNCTFTLNSNLLNIDFGKTETELIFEDCIINNDDYYLFTTLATYTVLNITFKNCVISNQDNIHSGQGTLNLTII